MKKTLVSLLIVFFTVSVLSQNIIDSLKSSLEKAPCDTAKIIIMLKLADNYYYNDIIKSREYFNMAKVLIEKQPFTNGTAYYYYVNGLMNDNIPAIALESYQRSLLLYTELNDRSGIANVNLAMGATYADQSKVNKGMKYLFTALKLFQSLNDKENIGICYSGIGIIYARQERYKLALEYSKKALNYYTAEDHAYYGEYVQIAYIYILMREEKTALLCYDSLVNKLKQKNYLDLLSNVYENIGNIYKNSENYSKAKQYYRSSYDIAVKIKDNYYLSIACLNIADLFVIQNQPDSAIGTLESVSPAIISLKSKKKYYSIISSAYEIKGDFESAIKYYKRYKIVSDSLNGELSNQRLYELQTSLEVDRKDEEIEALNKENQYKSIQLSKQRTIIVLILLSTLLFIVTAFVSYNRFRLKRKLVNMLESKNRQIEQQHLEIMAMNDMLERQNKNLLEMDSMKSRFFTNISHEFRTPLSLVIGTLTTMHDKAKEEETKNEFRLMLKHANNLLVLINQLLDLSKLQKASLRLQLSYSDINTFLGALIDSFSGRAADLAIALTYHSSPLPHLVWFDRDKLGKIVVNIISNALKHTPRGGSVQIFLARTIDNPDYLEIIVSDNGIGIEVDEIKNIFEPFYQSNATINRKIEGNGIGLALVKELVELHGGDVSVNSEAGKGAQFTIRIAVNKQLLPAAEKLVDKGSEYSTFIEFYQPYMNDFRVEVEPKIIKDKTTILVVEDNDDMRKYISKSLLPDYQIIEAANGQEGFDKAVEVSPYLIIADVMMPVMNGYEMTALIKNDQRTSHIPVIILTAKASEESKIEGLETAADDYVVKPFNIKELLLRIKNTIANRQKLRDKFQKCITVNPSEVTATSLDEQFLTKALQIIENHITESEFSVDDFCQEIGVSKTHVYRKLKALTNQSFTEFMRCIRLKRAASLLQLKSGNFTEIAYQTGFSNLSYFSRTFKEQFGVSPSEYTIKVNNLIKK